MANEISQENKMKIILRNYFSRYNFKIMVERNVVVLLDGTLIYEIWKTYEVQDIGYWTQGF